MFADKFCLFLYSVRTYLDGVVFKRLWADHGGAAGSQLCYSHMYLFVTDFFGGISLIFPIIFSWFPILSTRKDSVNVLCWEKVVPEPFDHVVLSCGLPGKQYFCGSLWRCELSSQVAFTVCVRGREDGKGALFYLFIVQPCLFSLFKVMVAVLHLSLWPSLLKKVLLVAVKTVQSLCAS